MHALDDMTDDQIALMNKMSELSEFYYSAGWVSDLEYSLWRVLQGETSAFAGGNLQASEIQALRDLSDKCGGWIIWKIDKYLLGEVFIPMNEWLIHYVLSR